MQTVLFADADRELCDIYGELLEPYDYRVEMAGNGVECMTKLRQLRPDLLVLDLDLPWGGGDGVLAVMRKDPRLALIPVVLTATGASQALDRLLATRLVVQLLTKPFQLSALLACLPMPTPLRQESTPNGADRPGILVVDDEAAVCKMLRTHLERQGFRVWTALDGEEALDVCCDHGEEIAVVLLDVVMPGLDGLHTLDGIRAFSPETPVCFMTAGESNPDDLLARGARHVFRKPFRLKDLTRIVQRLVHRKSELQAENGCNPIGRHEEKCHGYFSTQDFCGG